MCVCVSACACACACVHAYVLLLNGLRVCLHPTRGGLSLCKSPVVYYVCVNARAYACACELYMHTTRAVCECRVFVCELNNYVRVLCLFVRSYVCVKDDIMALPR